MGQQRDPGSPPAMEIAQTPMSTRLKNGLIAIGVVLLIAGLAGTYYVLSINSQYDRARGQADVVRAHFSTDDGGLSLDQIPQITDDLTQLEADLRELDRRVERPLLGNLARNAPFVGEQVRASQELLDLGIELTSISRDTSEIANEVRQAFEANGFMGEEPPDGPTWLDVVNAHWDDIHELERRYAAAMEMRADLDTEHLPGRALGTLDSLDGILVRGESLRDEYFHLFPMLNTAFGAHEDAHYLILLQSSQELRPGGGFVGTYGAMTVSNGRISSLEIAPVGELNAAYWNARTETLPAPAPISRYLLQHEWLPHDANWSADFPTVADRWNAMYEDTGWPALAGILAVNDSVVEAVLEILGPYDIEIGERVETVTPENFMDLIQSLRDGDESHKHFVGELGRSIIDQTLEADFDTKKEIFWSLRDSADEREIQVALADPALQAEVVNRGWDGALLPDPELATLALTISNVTGNKSSPMVWLDVYLDVAEPDANGKRKVEWTISLSHLGDPDGNLEFNGFHRTWLEVYLPSNATLISTSLEPEPEDMVEDPRAIGFHIELLTGDYRQLLIKFVMPAEEDQLLLRRQSGMHNIGYQIVFDAPECSADEWTLLDHDYLIDFTTCKVAVFDRSIAALQ